MRMKRERTPARGTNATLMTLKQKHSARFPFRVELHDSVLPWSWLPDMARRPHSFERRPFDWGQQAACASFQDLCLNDDVLFRQPDLQGQHLGDGDVVGRRSDAANPGGQRFESDTRDGRPLPGLPEDTSTHHLGPEPRGGSHQKSGDVLRRDRGRLSQSGLKARCFLLPGRAPEGSGPSSRTCWPSHHLI